MLDSMYRADWSTGRRWASVCRWILGFEDRSRIGAAFSIPHGCGVRLLAGQARYAPNGRRPVWHCDWQYPLWDVLMFQAHGWRLSDGGRS